MNELLFWILVFVGVLILLIQASNWFVKASEYIGLALGVSPFVIGITIVAFGTSLPELATSIAAVYSGTSEIVIGNVIGSNIANLGFVMGCVAVFNKKWRIRQNPMDVDIPLLTAATFMLYFIIADLKVTTFEAILLLAGMAIFLGNSIASGKDSFNTEKVDFKWFQVVILVASGLVIYFSSVWTVTAIENIATLSGIGADVISLTLVAFGTSLPEVAVSIVAARRGQLEMALGNIIGSNIFNTFAVVGIPALIGSLVIPPDILTYSMPFMMAITLLFVISIASRGVNRWEGSILLLFYIVFLVGLFT